MFKKPLFLSIVAVSLCLTAAYAKDFVLSVLPHAKQPMFDMNSVEGKMSYYDYVRSTIGPKMREIGVQSGGNESVLRKGGGTSVKLSQNNYNVHINYPNSEQGGRSYGWTSGKVGDWSDEMFLDNLIEVPKMKNKHDIKNFFKWVIQMVGACRSDTDSLSIESLSGPAQRVAANFLAIYTAEAYRRMVGGSNWDDALFQVTLLGAFHGGQSTLTKFYMGKFSTTSKRQAPGVYARGKPGPAFASAKTQAAEMDDYWQFSADPDSTRSGINLTRSDFSKMGAAITEFEEHVKHNPLVAKIRSTVGGNPNNVIEGISKFFAEGKSHNIAVIDQLAEDVGELMLNVYDHAEELTKWELGGEHL